MTEHQDILAVGDLHGELGLLQQMLGDLLPRLPEATQLVFLGDYIDRGPDSKGVVETMLRLREARPDTVFLMGNHESLILGALQGLHQTAWLANGGRECLESYGLDPGQIHRLPPEHLDFFASLDLYYETPEYIFVHGGLRPGVELNDQKARDLLWIRDDFFMSECQWPKTVVFGHTPFHAPWVTDCLIGIDTGAVFGNRLTCLKLPEKEFHHFPARQKG